MKSSYIIPQVEVDSQNYYYYQNTFTEAELQNLEIPSRMKPGFLQLETMTFEARKPL